MRYRALYSVLFVLFTVSAFAQNNPYGPDIPEPGSVEAIAKDTTEARYMSPWVAYVPESPTVPSPSDFLGRIAGAAGYLTHTDEIYAYMRELDRASDRVKVEVIGQTEEGREILLVIIADETGIKNLDELKAATAALSDPRKTTPERAREIVRSARPMYYLNAAVHADESISPDMSIELAYRLAVSEQPYIRNIRENVVTLINPVANPDGRSKLVEWFNMYLKGKTDYDNLPRQSPPYWGKYVYVDANRDAHQLTLSTTRAVARMFFEYHPVAIHDLHEAIALLQTWNGTGPYNPHLDPIVLSRFLEMSFHEMSVMSSFGMPGVWTWDFGEGFGHHYTDSIAMNHNAIGRGYETYGNTVAETVTRKLDPPDVTREWYRPWPPPERTFRWSHRNGLNYVETGCLSILDYAARHADELLLDFYQTGYNSWSKGKAGNPYAFVIPSGQPDELRTARMINRLLNQKIEVGRAKNEIKVKEGSFPAGSYVVQLDQPYRNYAVDLLLPQEFPLNSPPPYDDVSWSLPVHYGVETKRIDDAAILQTALETITAEVQPKGVVHGSGPVFLLREAGQEALLAARYRLADFRVEIAEAPFQSGGAEYPRGSWILPSQTGIVHALEQVSAELALNFDSAAAVPNVPRHEATVPRLGVWVPWADTDMIGWIRLTLDHQKIPFTYLRDEEIRAGNLKNRVDVIVYGNVLLTLQGQIQGIDRMNGAMPYKKTDRTPSHGVPAESDDITGGIGWLGLANLQQFVEDGGILITMGRGSELLLETGLVRNVQSANLDNVSTPGAELRARFLQPEHPIGYGYPEITSAFRSNFKIYDPPRTWLTMSYCTSCLNGSYDFKNVVLQWGTRRFQSDDVPVPGPIIVSGGGRGADQLEGRPAILDVPIGKGRALVFNFNPMHRNLNYSDHRYLWNGILNWQYLASRSR
jgi:hypothetical protein